MPPLHCEFVKWITTTPTLILPNFPNTFLPLVRFKNASRLVTLDWNRNLSYYNLDCMMFPNVETVIFIDGHPGDSTVFTRFPLWISNRVPPQFNHTNIHIDSTIKESYWRPSEKKVQYQPNQWVNEDWLKTQYEELFRIAQNELEKRPEMK